MAEFDPYATLRVARTAPAAAIKAAYRVAVQTAHPDRGGDPEAFIRIVKAFDLLSDPEARRLYDEAGIVDEDAVRAFRRDVARILADMFDAAVETAVATGLDLGRVDFVRQMTAAVKTGLVEARAALVRADRDISALAALKQRIKHSGEGQNIFGARLDAQVAGKLEEQRQGRRRVLLMETALVELGNYSSEVELISALERAP
ncbi:MAG TPA: DnaJ domain-containing protein [Alphaproteobacteria bacterium]|nr:DnaJ domain-containing protein [Alphaproteobacteria bacterium]